MRTLVTLLGAWLCLSTVPCLAEGRLHERLKLADAMPDPEPTQLNIELSIDTSELSLVPPLELPSIMDEAPTMHEAIVPPYLVMVGRVRGAMLDRCRSRMRNIALIGHGASTDGRPDTCRLLSFVGRTKFRERAISRRAGVRTRFAAMRIEEMPEMPRFASNTSAPLVTSHALAVPRPAPAHIASGPPSVPRPLW